MLFLLFLLFLFLLLLLFFVCVCVCVCVCIFFSRDSNMISLGTVEFRYYVAIIMPANFVKP